MGDVLRMLRHRLALRLAPWLEPQDSEEWARTQVLAEVGETLCFWNPLMTEASAEAIGKAYIAQGGDERLYSVKVSYLDVEGKRQEVKVGNG